MSSKPGPHAKQDPDGHWNIGGVYVGKRIDLTLYAEPVANRRHLIRSTLLDPTFAVRIGEVFGGDRTYQACEMRGAHVVMETSLIRAAKHLEAHEYRDRKDAINAALAAQHRTLSLVQEMASMKALVAKVKAQTDLAQLDAMYVDEVGYSIVEDDPAQTVDDIKGTLLVFLKEVVLHKGISPADVGLDGA